MNEAQDFDATFAGTEEERRDKASEPILREIRKAQKDFRDWQDICQLIDDVYSRYGATWDSLHKLYGGITAWNDNDLDLFWASMEVLKPAVYARAPKPAVRPLFSDADLTKTKTAELLERVSTSALLATDINEVMYCVRDDLLFTNRGVMWVRYESQDGQRICIEHLDRRDFLHETARKWSHVGWVAGGFWMSPKEMKDRFVGKNGITEETLEGAKFIKRRDGQTNGNDNAVPAKCQVWEVWHKADNRVYWVTEGIDVLLDSGEPHLKLKGFFPCPRPAYGTLRRRSLIPVPDWDRYAIHFRKIGDLTGRIYRLLDDVRMKGLIPAGGDAGDAVEQLIRSDDDRLLIPVPAAALMAQSSGDFVIWLPLDMLAATIQGLIESRQQLISDFYQLSGISDIMRGATEAEETLGAQQLKSQYGSVRVRDKIDELQRIAADTVGIIAEIASEKFSQKTLLDMAQMEIPTKRDLDKRVKEIEDAAEEELKGLETKAREQAEQQTQNLAAGAPNGGGGASPPPSLPDPAQAQAMLQQAQQAILQKYGVMLQEVQKQVPVEDVMKLLRDDKARSFAFEVESDSTIMTDELQEKASRNEFLERFSGALQNLTGLMAMGEQGAKLAGEMTKFVLAPYRAGRQLDGAIDAFIEAAPEMAAKAAAANGQTEQSEELVAAQKELAEAEKAKAAAAMASVQARAAQAEADNQRKYMELQASAANDAMKAEQESNKLQLQLADMDQKASLQEAQINKLTAETAAILNKIGLDVRAQELSEYQAANQAQVQQVDQEMRAEETATEVTFRERGEERSDRQQQFTERQAQQESGQ